MTAKNLSARKSSKTATAKKLGLKKETLRDLAVKGQSAVEVRGNVSTAGRLGINYPC